MKSAERILAAALLLAAVSCGRNARVSGVLKDAADTSLVVRLLDVDHFRTLDTLRTGADGSFRCTLPLKKGQPEFVYLFYGTRQVAALLLVPGDRVRVEADTLGRYEVSGSPESALLQETDRDFALFRRDFIHTANRAKGLPAGSAEAAAVEEEISRSYVAYYRKSLAYVMGHVHSLTVVPVLFRQVTPTLPLFAQATDGLLFQTVADSLRTVWPESRYVRALEQAARTRTAHLEMENRLKNAPQAGFPDIILPDSEGRKTALSEQTHPVILVHFWTPAETEQSLFGADVLARVYERFRHRGFGIYSVALTADKNLWADVVKGQSLPWTNVCDTRAGQSPYIRLYNLETLPASYLVAGGEIQDVKVKDEASLCAALDELLP